MSEHLSVLGMDYIFFAISVYISVRAFRIRNEVYLRRFCNLAHSVTLMEIVNIILRLRLCGAIHPGANLTYILYALNFMVITFASMEWCIFFEVIRDRDYLNDPTNKTFLMIPFWISFLLCLVSFFTGWLFYVDADGMFNNGSLYIFQYIIPYTYALKFLIGMIKTLRTQKENYHRNLSIVLGTIIPIVAGTLLQAFFRGSYIVSSCVIGCLVIYIELIIDEMGKNDKYAALNDVNKELEKTLKKTKEDYNLIRSLASAYEVIYLISLEEQKYREIYCSKDGARNVFGEMGDAVEQFDIFCKHICCAEHVESMQEFTDLKTLPSRLSGKKFISLEYECNLSGWSEATFIPVDRDEAGNLSHVLFATIDVNNKKIVEFEHANMVEIALAQAQKANRAKTIFLNNLSHDIRTPMNAIEGFTNLALRNVDDKEVCKESLTNISAASKHMIALINDIIDLNRLENGKMQIMEKEIDFKKFLEDLLTIVQPEAENKGLSLESNISGIESKYIVADRLRLEQILLNIISNSIEYTEKGGKITLEVKEVESKLPTRADFEIVLTDTGVGMTQDQLKNIFEAFVNEKSDTVNSNYGSGLGMAITKSFVDLLGGQIRVESKPGEGSTFALKFSFAKCNGVTEEKDIEDMVFTGKKLLLVEDNMLNQEIAKAILEELGFSVKTANNGQEAVEMLAEAGVADFDAVLMDIRMPKLNGYEATIAIRNLDTPIKSIPIVAMTANAFEEDKRRAFESGMNAHLAKPIDIKLLKATLARVL